MRHSLVAALASVLMLETSSASLLPQATPAASLSAYSESIPGTLVAFDMVPVPEGTVVLDGKTVKVGPFYIGKTEVTWDMYDAFALAADAARGSADAIARPSRPYGAPDYGWGHAGYPAISIARTGAQAFAEWLSKKTGKKYRLPTEAEWARAAALAAPDASAPMDALAWHEGNSGGKTHPVGAKKPDALGLSDLFGNAAEWVTTPDDGHVTRGGSIYTAVDKVGPAARAVQEDWWNERDPQIPKSRWWLSDGPFVGFRLVREP
ncbi:MAG TPA: SUMF1/EgtB/PvdO family nonheme iron enzyme [Vicinamibacterales bacterium]|nr:SUMF1/EgtB/PvdO family nonheme iron enzyme [Vicinamibacterales bacterium]